MSGIEDLRGLYAGQTCWVVGSGPSIRSLEGRHFGDGPVIAINYAIEIVEALGLDNPVYSLQKDQCFIEPQMAALLVHDKESKHCFGDYWPQFRFSMESDFRLRWNRPSDNAAVAFADWFGCGEVVFLCCDASVNGDIRGYKRGRISARRWKPENLRRHKGMIEEVAERFGIGIRFEDVRNGQSG